MRTTKCVHSNLHWLVSKGREADIPLGVTTGPVEMSASRSYQCERHNLGRCRSGHPTERKRGRAAPHGPCGWNRWLHIRWRQYCRMDDLAGIFLDCSSVRLA
jgi:hypothetical protein